MTFAPRTWLRTRLAWSNSRQAWQDRASGLVLLAGTLALCWYRDQLSLAQQLMAWAVLTAGLALLLRRGWFKLFGPVLFYELVRLGRQNRHFLFRALYGGFLTFLLCWVYLIWVMDESVDNRLAAGRMASFANSFFQLYVGVQFVALVILTPAYVAGAIAEEKDRKTLEFLLTTDLHNREIVLSKLVSRLASLLLIAITGLPILSLLQFVGGVDPNLVIAAFAATGLTILSLAGLSILNSVWATKTRDAIAYTYLQAAAYLILSSMSLILIVPGLGLSAWPSSATWASPVTVEDVVRWLNSGNIVAALIELEESVGGGGRIDATLLDLLRRYAIFHAIVAAWGTTWAVLRMRAIAVGQLYGKAAKRSLSSRVWGRPRIGRRPMVWKEVFAEPGLRLNWFGWLLVVALLLACFAPIILIIAFQISEWVTTSNNVWQELAELANWWVRIAGTLVACLLLMTVAVRASSSIGLERDRQTLESLLTTPLEPGAILGGKWLGSVLCVRWGWLWLGLIWAIGLATRGLHPLAVPALAASWFVYASFIAMLGLWFSVVCRTTLRATIWTLFGSVMVGVGHWFVMTLCFYVPLQTLAGIEDEYRWIPEFEAFGMTPPLTLGLLAFQGWEFEDHFFLNADDFFRWSLHAAAGIACWTVGSLSLWLVTWRRFRALTGRAGIVLPKQFADAARGQLGGARTVLSDQVLNPDTSTL